MKQLSLQENYKDCNEIDSKIVVTGEGDFRPESSEICLNNTFIEKNVRQLRELSLSHYQTLGKGYETKLIIVNKNLCHDSS